MSPYEQMASIPLASRAFNEQMRLNFESELHRSGSYTATGMGDGKTGIEAERSAAERS